MLELVVEGGNMRGVPVEGEGVVSLLLNTIVLRCDREKVGIDPL
jgi:hypothetical protein